jgi:hypothetical protein
MKNVQCMDHVWFPTKDKHGTNKGGDWLGAIAISNYETMWLAHGSQVIDHITRNKGKEETCLVGGILHAQACDKGWKIRINKVLTGHDKRMWVGVRKGWKTKKNV